MLKSCADGNMYEISRNEARQQQILDLAMSHGFSSPQSCGSLDVIQTSEVNHNLSYCSREKALQFGGTTGTFQSCWNQTWEVSSKGLVCMWGLYVRGSLISCDVDVEVIAKLYNMDFGIPKMPFVLYLTKYGNHVKGKCQGAIKLPFLSPVHLSVDKWKEAAAKITVNE